MNEPSPRTSRLVVAGSAAAILLLGGGGFLFGRSTAPEPPVVVVNPVPVPVAKPVTPEAATPRTLSRADIIAIGNAAADATSSGTKMPDIAAATEGARFEVDLPFGCDGPAADDSLEPTRWRYDAESSSLRISVASVVFDPAEWLGASSSSTAATKPPVPREEAIEGFWIARPWSSRGTCISGSATAAPLAVNASISGQTLGLAQVFTDEDTKNGRRDGKPYETVRRMAEDDLKIDDGLRLRLRGRVARFPDGSAVRCRQPAGREQRPVCLVAVTFDDVAIENPSTKEVIATFSSAQRA